jgi:hypothetical protein
MVRLNTQNLKSLSAALALACTCAALGCAPAFAQDAQAPVATAPNVATPAPMEPAPTTPTPAVPAPPSVCDKSQFEAVVDEAGAALRALNQNHKPVYQEKLRALKDKRGWSNDQFMTEAAPLVKDEKIDGFDQTSNTLLSDISGRGEEEASAKTPDCALLLELRAKLKLLVDTQTQKWAYMFDKISAEMAK